MTDELDRRHHEGSAISTAPRPIGRPPATGAGAGVTDRVFDEIRR